MDDLTHELAFDIRMALGDKTIAMLLRQPRHTRTEQDRELAAEKIAEYLKRCRWDLKKSLQCSAGPNSVGSKV